ncbi:MAG: Asp-tRNA(Asn)/Glu-tRNA(Gln) amidotransferase subunit GatA [Parcubacteria group bacterium]|nr:Asp-tRNA(Asn)/Glu-tRNA(Gln) amidotransferase subunit GatA [Parcubacteria group bacterium]
MLLNQLTISEAANGIKNKKFSIRELVSDCLSAIKKNDKKIHSFLAVFDEYTIERAEYLDKNLAQQKKSFPLYGIPIAIKDNILIKNYICTAGSKILEKYRAPYHATVINRLESSGAIFIGKTNLDEFAMGSSTENSAFGATKNPRDIKRVPGGSSGGSAAAVAAQFCLGALGSDTGGSIRQPASFCGVYGLKPTYGRVSRFGLIAMASSLDQIGPLARSIDDTALLLSVIEGKDQFDSTSVELKEKILYPVTPLKQFTIGIADEFFSDELDASIKTKIFEIIHTLEKNGVRVKKIKLPSLSYSLPCYYIIMPAEVSSNLARFDGIKYGLSTADKDTTLQDIYYHTRQKGFGAEVKRRILIGAYVLSKGYYDAYYGMAQKARSAIKNDFARAFKEVDCIITPTAPTLPFKLKEKINDPLKMYLSDIYTVSVNLAGLPALSQPIGIDEKTKLPIGMQLIGNYFEENRLLSIGKTIEQQTDSRLGG